MIAAPPWGSHRRLDFGPSDRADVARSRPAIPSRARGPPADPHFIHGSCEARSAQTLPSLCPSSSQSPHASPPIAHLAASPILCLHHGPLWNSRRGRRAAWPTSGRGRRRRGRSGDLHRGQRGRAGRATFATVRARDPRRARCGRGGVLSQSPRPTFFNLLFQGYQQEAQHPACPVLFFVGWKRTGFLLETYR